MFGHGFLAIRDSSLRGSNCFSYFVRDFCFRSFEIFRSFGTAFVAGFGLHAKRADRSEEKITSRKEGEDEMNMAKHDNSGAIGTAILLLILFFLFYLMAKSQGWIP